MKACSFFGHRDTPQTEELKQKVRETVKRLIEGEGVDTFLFGSRSKFDDLCHCIVTEMQKNNSHIKRIVYICRSEYACIKEEKEERERIARAVVKQDIKYKDYEGSIMSNRLCLAGKASYVERNQDMIDASDYCVFYYNENYQPPKRKYSKRDVCEYQPKSGTQIAFDYANLRRHRGKEVTIINLYEKRY